MHLLLYFIFALAFGDSTNNNSQAIQSELNVEQVSMRNTSSIHNPTENQITEYQILPVDESSSDPSLVAFIDNLKKIVAKKDAVGLLKSLDTAIIVSYGGAESGKDAFAQAWNLDNSANSELWPLISKILPLGGTWGNEGSISSKYFFIPYAQSNKIISQYNDDYVGSLYNTAVCIHPKVKVYQAANDTSHTITTLNYSILRIDPSAERTPFTKVKTLDNTVEGYVKTDDIVFTADPYLALEKLKGTWKIIAFAPYD